MQRTEKTVNTCIVVVEVEMDGSTTVIGALVDSVQEEFEIESKNIEPAPKIGTKLDRIHQRNGSRMIIS